MRCYSTRTCQYQDWWDRRASGASCKKNRHAGNNVILLPRPVFPPALDFDASRFTLPPSYDDIVDLEKAVYPSRPRSQDFSDTSTLVERTDSEETYRTWTKTEHNRLQEYIPRHVRILRKFRYNIFNVYRRLFTFVVILNIIGAFILVRTHHSQRADGLRISSTLATLASSNFLLAILIRQDYLVNLLFRTAWLVAWTMPNTIRNMVARVYCYGGIHSGAAVAGSMWWIAYTAWTCRIFVQDATSLSVTILSCLVLMILVVILILSCPSVRARYHNTFEITHRLLGWLSIMLFWAQLLLIHHTSSTPGTRLIQDPTFWNLIIITLLLLYPWLRIRRWTFTAHVLSSHALRLSFPNPIHRFSCLSISSSPLLEWHPFATFPLSSAETSMVISNAGDWTRNMIHSTIAQSQASPTALMPKQQDTDKPQDAAPQVKLTFYTRPHPKAGVLSLSLLFPRILILTTGSGIGPALSSLLERPPAQFARLIWSTRSPLATYGAEMMALVRKADSDALVLDTDEMGRPDLLAVVLKEAAREGVDAVFVLSNEKVVKWVVGGVEARGGRGYGPIWDS
ncbi:hypothetical protein DE146DRAFT_602502 [Phaeosphaeria sp. MPI-PUGE-AT-0046c]|nr:hypothetical protein DE146DRAFT_602502 [Phaeosphaeria sp. MPI-PUGE-AT-0046c]